MSAGVRRAAAGLWTDSGAVGRIAVRGDSMAPLIRAGDRIRLRADARPRIGDVVAAFAGDVLVVHRLVARRGDRLVLRGDAVPWCDPPIAASAVLGTVTAVECRDRPWRRLDGIAECCAAGLAAVVTLGALRGARGVARPAKRGGSPAAGSPERTLWPRPAVVARALLAVEQRLLPPMSPEEAVVLLACRQRISEEAAARARALIAEGLDWARVVALARRGQVGPMLHAGLGRLGAGAGVPAATLAGTRALYAGSWARSRRMAALLERMVADCAAEGIELLAHKGAALSLTVYGDPAVRIAGDLDLSVRDDERARAEQLTHDLRSALVTANPDRRDPDGVHVELDGTAHHDLDASRHGGGRWRSLPLDWEGIWSRSDRMPIGAHAVRVPCATDLLLTLLANAIRRGFTPLRLVVDVAETVDARGREIRWEELAAALARTRLDRRAWIPLGLAAEWFDAAVPPALLEPPEGLRLLAHERAIVGFKRRRPLRRVPSRVLWAGSRAAAAAAAARLAATALRRRAMRAWP